jgi:hypothetical protein
MSRVRCFFLEQVAGKNRYSLRRWASGGDRSLCTGSKLSYHNAEIDIGEGPPVVSTCSRSGAESPVPISDARWPKKCASCDYVFTDGDFYQYNSERVFRRTDTGAELTLSDAPEGAMWFADWYQHFKGPDGHTLVVRLRGNHDWIVDSRASNCTMKDDNEHRCWTRKSSPPDVDVGKAQYGKTCAAGAGSIAIPGYHGFLRNGWLEEC